MTLSAIFGALVSGNPCLIPAEYRVIITQRIILSRKKAVIWQGHLTRCPVCEVMLLGLSEIRVNRTDGEVRYCECRRCLATFQATGPAIERDFVGEKPPKKTKNKLKKR